uniref:Uncharacterized protein n=1 Tax=Colobus angolensis palliatus TaxID=336983 RepID=A0A2K5HQH4_COLAP
MGSEVMCRVRACGPCTSQLALSCLGWRKTPSAWGGQGPMSVLKEAGLDKGHNLAEIGQVLRPRHGPSQNLLPWNVSSRPSYRAVILHLCS